MGTPKGWRLRGRKSSVIRRQTALLVGGSKASSLACTEAPSPPVRCALALAITIAPAHAGVVEPPSADTADHLDKKEGGPPRMGLATPSDPILAPISETWAVISRVVEVAGRAGVGQGPSDTPRPKPSRAVGIEAAVGPLMARRLDIALATTGGSTFRRRISRRSITKSTEEAKTTTGKRA